MDVYCAPHYSGESAYRLREEFLFLIETEYPGPDSVYCACFKSHLSEELADFRFDRNYFGAVLGYVRDSFFGAFAESADLAIL